MQATGPEWWAEALRIVPEHGAIVLFACGTFTADLMWARRELYRYKWVWHRGRPTGMFDCNKGNDAFDAPNAKRRLKTP